MKKFLVILILFMLCYFHKELYILYTQTHDKILAVINSKKTEKTSNSPSLKNVTISKVYLLKTDKWLYFDISATQNIKITTTANIKQKLSQNLIDKEWFYKVEFEMISDSGKTIFSKNQTLRTKIPIYKKNNLLFTEKFYLQQESIPGISNNSETELTDIKHYDRLRIRLVKKNRHIDSVAVRVYKEIINSSRKIPYIWKRLGEQEQQKVSSDNLYPYKLLHEKEKFSLLQQEWKPLAPKGIPSKDYEYKNLYRLNKIDGTLIKQSILPEGFFLDKDLRKTINIPIQGAKLHLQLTSMQKQSSKIWIIWHGKGINNKNSKTLTFKSFQEYSFFFETGLVEIITLQPLLLNGKIQVEDRWINLLDTKKYIRSFASQKKPIIYRLFHEQNRKTPIRLDVRYFSQKRFLSKKPRLVECHILTKQKKLLQKLLLKTAFSLSNYAIIWEKQQKYYTSEPQSHYFQVPNDAYYLMIKSNTSRLVTNLYNRPPTLIKHTSVPEDYYIDYDKKNNPSWFLLSPSNYYTLVEKQQTKLISLQTKPKENPNITTEQAPSWETYQPNDKWTGQYILIPEEVEEINSSKEKLPFQYYKIDSNSKNAISFYADYQQQQVNPTLLYHNRQKKRFSPIRIYIDNTLIYSNRLLSTIGQITLPPIAVGKKLLDIRTAQNINFYINYTHRKTSMLRKQMAIKLNKNLQFVYTKNLNEENILIRVYHLWGEKRRSIFRVSIKSQQQAYQIKNDWTFYRRTFSVKPNQKKQCYSLHSKEILDNGELIIFPLKADIMEGKYNIELEQLSGNAKYLTIAKLQIEPTNEREIFYAK
ncbi:hypothetical protein [Candidatus Uabimicrobium sp. HlEnr_7]|uniref:hypothetical protein n=1 Tax=Candidatus Uabimicrobium helgolandensis TaxID=3095367 RepID=UPI003558C815